MKIATIAIAASLIGTAAYAGGPVVPVAEPTLAPAPVVVAPATPWQGGYVGGSLVYGDGTVDAKDEAADFLGFFGIDNTLGEPEGFGPALRIGYDWQFNKAVVGLGASYDFNKYDDTKYDVIDTEVSDIKTLFVRAGYDAGRWMPYVLAGYSWADGEASIDGLGSESVDLDGYTVGFGASYMITDRWVGFAEYNYTDFGDIDKTDGLLEADLNRLNLGVTYKF